MPGGRGEVGETPLETSMREFKEETGHELESSEDWSVPLGNGKVHFGFIGDGDPSKRSMPEITEISLFSELPSELAYPEVEYLPLIGLGRQILSKHLTSP